MSGYLFYSNKCQTCTNLRSIMEQQQLLGMFNCKNIDTMTMVDIEKLGLGTVPTILVVSSQNGQTRQGIYEGNNAFVWVKSVVENRRQNMLRYTENTRRLIQMGEMKKKMQDGLMDYSSMETQGVSDDYSYWSDNTNIDQKLDTAQSKSFLQYDKDFNKYVQISNQNRVITIPVDIKEKGYKLSKSDQDKLTADLDKQRNSQLESIKSNMQQEHIKSVINAENGLFQ